MQDIGAVFQILILIMSVVLHEVSHGYMAYALGDHTAKYQGRLTLNPLKHIDPVGSIIVPILTYATGGFVFGWAKPVPYNPYNLRNQKTGEGLVAFAGPLANISVAIVFGILIRILMAQGFGEGPFAQIASLIVLVNLVLAVFNLVPIPPLDGSKILFSLLPNNLLTFRRSFEKYSMFLVLFFVFVLWQYLLPVVYVLFWLITGSRL